MTNVQVFASELRAAASRCGFHPQVLANRIGRSVELVERLLAGEADETEIDESLVDDLAVALVPAGSTLGSEQPDVRAARWFDVLGMTRVARERRSKLLDPS